VEHTGGTYPVAPVVVTQALIPPRVLTEVLAELQGNPRFIKGQSGMKFHRQ
jgi:hypothetical protein